MFLNTSTNTSNISDFDRFFTSLVYELDSEYYYAMFRDRLVSFIIFQRNNILLYIRIYNVCMRYEIRSRAVE